MTPFEKKLETLSNRPQRVFRPKRAGIVLQRVQVGIWYNKIIKPFNKIILVYLKLNNT